MSSEKTRAFDILKDNNPFASSSAGSPWEGRYPDVPGLGDDVFQGITQLIRLKAQNPGAPCSGLVLGDAGSGKTHLIGRLFDHGKNETCPYSCAYIQPIIDPNKAFRYLLREIVTSLIRKYDHEGVACQLEIMIAGIFAGVLEEAAKTSKSLRRIAQQIKKDPGKVLKLKPSGNESRDKWIKETKSFLKKRHPDLDPEFVNVLVQYLFFPKRRDAANNWLKGFAIDEDDLELLKVRDRSAMDVAGLEAEAHEIIKSLDSLLVHYSGRPLVVFFDQLENLKTDDLIQKFCQLVYFLGDQCRIMLPVAFFRELQWKEEYSFKMDQSCAQRLESNQMAIPWATRRQALELVQSRLNHVLGETPREHSLYPFYPDYKDAFDQMFAYDEIFPRQALIRSNKLLKQIITGKPPAPSEQGDPVRVLLDEFESRHQEILAGFNEYSPDEGRLTLALEQYLLNRPENAPYRFDQLKWSSAKVKYVDLRGTLLKNDGSQAETVFIVDVELHHGSVGASLDRGVKHMEKQKAGGRALYVRDKRCKFPAGWKKNTQRLEKFRSLNGGVIFLDDKQAARWYALARLKQDVEAGDITDRNGKIIGEPEYRRFIREQVNGDAFPSFKPVDTYFEGQPDDSGPEPDAVDDLMICRTAMKILYKSPAKMMKAEFLAMQVEKTMNIESGVDSDKLLSAFNEAGKKDMFNIYGSPPGVIIQLRIKKYHDQG